jgi:hypothetical protein
MKIKISFSHCGRSRKDDNWPEHDPTNKQALGKKNMYIKNIPPPCLTIPTNISISLVPYQRDQGRPVQKKRILVVI